MTPKSPRAKRIERLTKRPPVFRPIAEDDWPILAVAYERGAFDFEPGMSPAALRLAFADFERQGYRISVVEDSNPHFRAGRGLVGLIMAKFDGWAVQPELFKFPWATTFNVVRGLAAFLLEMKRSRHIGVCVVKARESSIAFLNRFHELKLLFKCGYIPNGYPDSAMFILNVAGKKQKAG